MGDERPDRFNYLVISDLHLQEVERNPTGRLFYFDDEFANFLQYYIDGRRWKLVINGDFVEFYHILVRPDPADELLKGVTLYPTDLKFFPGTEWQKSVWKLQVALQGHPDLLRELARFLAGGNEIHMVRGNHDLEFCWPQVQEHFRLLVAQHHPADVSLARMQALTRERIHFLPWFYFEPGLLYVEHGHQYDAYCSNAHNLYPVLPGSERRIELAISALAMRYCGSRIEVVDPIAMENINSIPRYLWRLIKANPTQIVRMPLYYLEGAYRIVMKVTRPDPGAEAAVAAKEAEIRQQVEKASGVDAKTLRRIEGLAQAPIIRHWGQSVRCTLIDLVVVGLLALSLGVLVAVFAPSAWDRWSAGLLATLTVLLVLVGRDRLGKMNDHRNLRRIARRIRNILDVRYVVFGHSHDPDVFWLDPTRKQVYFNVGTWMPKGRDSHFIYLQIDFTAGEPSAHLMRWPRGARRPLEVEPTTYQKRWRRRAMVARLQADRPPEAARRARRR